MGNEKKQSEGGSVGTLVNLSPEELQRLPKPRAGFLSFAPAVFALYEANDDRLTVEGQTPAGALKALREYEALLAQEAALRKQLQLVQDTRVLRGASVWTLMLDLYALATAIGRNDPTMQRAISLFAHFMKKHGLRKRKATAATEPTTPAAPLVSQ